MTVNSSANSVILILFVFSDNLSAENSKLSAESGLPGLSLLGSMYILYMYPKQKTIVLHLLRKEAHNWLPSAHDMANQRP